MVKLLGSLCILAGGGLAWWFQAQERRRRRETLSDLIMVLRQMSEEIRISRTPLPALLQKLAANCGGEAAELFQTAAKAASRGEQLTEVWREGVEQLPLEVREKEILREMDFSGDEEKLCKGISHVTYRLAQSAEELERRRPEEEKRTTALCFSGAALLVILLI